MAKQVNKLASDIERTSKDLRASVGSTKKNVEVEMDRGKKAVKDFRSSVDRTKENLEAGMEKGKQAVKDHPKTAVGIALGATFAAGAVTGAALLSKGKKKPKA